MKFMDFKLTSESLSQIIKLSKSTNLAVKPVDSEKFSRNSNRVEESEEGISCPGQKIWHTVNQGKCVIPVPVRFIVICTI